MRSVLPYGLGWLLWGACAVHAQVAAPVIAPPGGGYTNALTNITVACATQGAEIHYTVNGFNPTQADPVYTTNPLAADGLSNVVIKACAFSGGQSSAVARVKYTFNPARNDARDYPNLMYNPSFEDTRQDRTLTYLSPECWQPKDYGRQDFSVCHSDQASWRFAGPATNQYTFYPKVSHDAQLILKPGTAYRLSAWIMTSSNLISGQGIGLTFWENNLSRQLVTTGYNRSTNWSKISATFTTSADHYNAQIRLNVNLAATNNQAWMDDVCLEPLDGVVSTAAPPVPVPNGGTYDGPVLVTLTSAVGSKLIRFTSNGADVVPWSFLYSGAYMLRTIPNLKAQVQHSAYKWSPVAVSSNFNLRTVLTNGVPFHPVDWRLDADTWWRGNPLNVLGTNYWPGPVVTPNFTVDVAVVRAANPTSQTAGIHEALDIVAAHPGGGVLYFPTSGSPYVVNGDLQSVFTRDWRTHANAPVTARYFGVTNYYLVNAAVMLLRMSNIFFVGENPSVTLKWDGGHTDPVYRAALFGISSMEYYDYKTFNTGQTRNIYFKNLTFDGCNSNVIGIDVRSGADVLIENCKFINHVTMNAGHPGVVIATACSDNIWARNCVFQGGQSMFYYDGVHGGGATECVFTGQTISVMASLCNDDMAPFSPTPRYSQYLVLSGNTSYGGNTFFVTSGGNALCADNRIYGAGNIFEAAGKPSATVPLMRYDYAGNIVRRNLAWNVSKLVRMTGWYESEVMSYYMGELRAESNRCYSGMATALDLVPNLFSSNVAGRAISNVFVRANLLAGPQWAQVKVNRPEVQYIYVTGNTFLGASTNLIYDQTGGTLDTNNIHFADNAFNPTLADVAFDPPGGTYTNLADVTLASAAADSVIRWTTNAALPVAEWNLYSHAIRLSNSATLSAQAFQFDGYVSSLVAAVDYAIQTKDPAGVTLQNLEQVFDGLPKAVTATTMPAGLTVKLTYAGATNPPVNAGAYAVTGVVDEILYEGSATATLTVQRADQRISFPGIGTQYISNRVGLAATADSGLPASYQLLGGPAVLAGMELTFTATGIVAVAASQAGNTNWNPAAAETNTFAVQKNLAAVSLTNLLQPYNGQPRTVGAVTVPAGLTVQILYAGAALAPTNAGEYPVSGTVQDGTCQGCAEATLRVSRAAQVVIWTNFGPAIATNQLMLNATASSGLPVEYFVSGPAVINTNPPAGGLDSAQPAAGSPKSRLAPHSADYVEMSGWVDLHGFVMVHWLVSTEEDVIGYTLYRRAGADWIKLNSGLIPADGGLGAGTYDYPDAGVRPNQTNFYRVEAIITTGSRWYNGPDDNGYPVTALDSGLYLYFTGAGTVTVVAAQSGNGNWDVALPWTNVIPVTQAAAQVAVSNANTVYDGLGHVTTATTLPAGLPVSLTYNGFDWAPTNAGTYAVTGTVADARYAGEGTGVLTIARATPGIAWTNPQAVASGAALGPAQLNASSPAAGGFIFSPPAGTVLAPGTAQVLRADFTPLDGANYSLAAAQVLLDVQPVIVASAGAHGALQPVGAVMVPYGSDTQFLARAAAYYHIGSLRTNGAPVAAVAGQAAYTVNWARVIADGMILADFAEDRAPVNGTPYWWLAQYGLTNGGIPWAAAETNDTDGDGIPNDQEYIALTDPTNTASYFHQEITGAGCDVLMQWQGAPGRLYRIWAASNLLAPGWTILAVQTGRTYGVMTFTNPLPPVWRYYRLSVVNTNS